MKSLNEFLLGKTKKQTISYINEYLLSKAHPKASTIQDEFCLVLAWGKVYDELCDEWDGAMITSNAGEPVLFLLEKTVAKEYFKKADSTQFSAYEIPKQYASLEEFDQFEEDYDNGNISIGNGIDKEIKF